MLLIGNHQSQIQKPGGVRQQGVGAHNDRNLSGSQPLPDFFFLLDGHGAGQQIHGNIQRPEELFQAGAVLLSQDFRGGHERGLLAVICRAERRRRGHHGLAAAHVALHQPVHGRALLKIRENLPNGPLLGPRQGKGQDAVKGLHITIGIRNRLFFRPGRPHQAQARGKDEEFLKNQPFFGLLRLSHILWLVNGEVGFPGGQDAVFPPHRLRQDFRRRVTHRQSLGNELQQYGVAQPRRQRIDGQYSPGGNARGLRRFEDGVRHIVAHEIPADRAVKDVFPAVLQLFRREPAVEKGHVQPPGGIRQLDLGHVQPLADVGGSGRVHHHGLEAGGHVRLQLGNGHQPGPILVAPGKMADQVAQGENIQIGKLLCPGFPHPFQDGHRVLKPRHGNHHLLFSVESEELGVRSEK